MSNKVFIYRHNPRSQGAKILARTLGIKMIRPENSAFTPAADKTIINWGCGNPLPFNVGNSTVINQPERVHYATHKRKFFERTEGVCSIPKFTTRRAEAEDWVLHGNVVFARTKLQGNSGEGIIEICPGREREIRELPEGTLFVEYIKKKHEFRIHVGDGKIIDRQQKKKRNDVDLEDINWRVRSHDNGFVFCRNDVKVPNCVDEQALAAMEVVGLDFGAVDVIYNQHYKKAYVLEINTAPGLEGTTVMSYKQYFAEKLGLQTEAEDVYDVIELARRAGLELDRE